MFSDGNTRDVRNLSTGKTRGLRECANMKTNSSEHLWELRIEQTKTYWAHGKVTYLSNLDLKV